MGGMRIVVARAHNQQAKARVGHDRHANDLVREQSGNGLKDAPDES
jgi:hypothetical protein